VQKKEIITKLAEHAEELRERFSVKTLAVFGSAVRDELTDTSDIDILVIFKQKATFDLFMDLKFYLEELLEADIDLVTDKALRPKVRQAIEGEMVRVA